IGEHASEAAPALLQRLFLRVLGMRVLALRVRLPDLDHSVADADAITVEELSGDRDALALHALAGDVARDEPIKADMVGRADGLVAAREETHGIFSIGVSSRPRRTMSKR